MEDTRSKGISHSNTATARFCLVCGDKATGYNFNAISCESCKAFFRRNASKKKLLQCPSNGSCVITIESRKFCPKCRLKKCLQVGMRPDFIMTEEELQHKRRRLRERARNSGRMTVNSDFPVDAIEHDAESPKTNGVTTLGSNNAAASKTNGGEEPPAAVPGASLALGRMNVSAELEHDGDMVNIRIPRSALLSIIQGSDDQTVQLHVPALRQMMSSVPFSSSENANGPSRSEHANERSMEYTNGFTRLDHVYRPSHLEYATEAPHLEPYVRQEFIHSVEPSLWTPHGHLISCDASIVPHAPGNEQVSYHGVTPNQGSVVNGEGYQNVSQPAPEFGQHFQSLSDTRMSFQLVPGHHAVDSMVDSSQFGNVNGGFDTRMQSGNALDPATDPSPPTDQSFIAICPSSDERPASYSPPQYGSDFLPVLTDLDLDGISTCPAICYQESKSQSALINWRPPSPILDSKSLNLRYMKLNELLMSNEEWTRDPSRDLLSSDFCIRTDNLANEDYFKMAHHALRCQIRQYSRLSGLKNLNWTDQMALLKGSARDLLVLRTSWKANLKNGVVRNSGSSRDCVLLPSTPGAVDIKECFPSYSYLWRESKALLLIASALLFFNANNPLLTNKTAVEAERRIYRHLLKDYLDSRYDQSESREAFSFMLTQLDHIGPYLKESPLNLSFELNPHSTEPMFVQFYGIYEDDFMPLVFCSDLSNFTTRCHLKRPTSGAFTSLLCLQ